MKFSRPAARKLLITGTCALLGLGLMQGMSLLGSGSLALSNLLPQALFTASVLCLAWLALLAPADPAARPGFSWGALFLPLLAAAAGWLTFTSGSTYLAWAFLALTFASLLVLNAILERGASRPGRWLIRFLLAFLAGFITLVLVQVEESFSGEEFFMALEAAGVGGIFLLLEIGWSALQPAATQFFGLQGDEHRTARLSRWAWVFTLVLLAASTWGAVQAYQGSFYPPTAPGFAGITSQAPFICETLPGEQPVYPAASVFQAILDRVQANPDKAVPEYGMLALAEGSPDWRQEFHQRLLDEARQGMFTQPANSIKSVQFDAARRAYYYVQVRQAYPKLFSAQEQELLEQWFAAINRRAQTVEWVDWMYALAFSQPPQGLYENQEIGAGLVALLEKYHLADPALSLRNRAYLEQNQRGWQERFRNTDDAIFYQPEWITNAYFQSLYWEHMDLPNLEKSFTWLLLQALPDGAPLRYNHVVGAEFDGISYLGALLTQAAGLQDPGLLWLAGQAARAQAAAGIPSRAVPGSEEAANRDGVPPQTGSCLVFGDSGLPNQQGPLAPDKVVFRSGWSPDALYLLHNLRFSGWHRYKATNDLILAYQAGPLVVEKLEGNSFWWLPEGRSHFRDKRVPRENLNGLVIRRSGLSQVLYTLAGIGGPWAQDPPYYARVNAFTTSPEIDHSRTTLENWRGWEHQRDIFFSQEGVVAIQDRARGPAGSAGAILWHLVSAGGLQSNRIRLRAGDNPAELLIIPAEGVSIQAYSEGAPDSAPNLRLEAHASPEGEIELITLLLTGNWAGAQAQVIDRPGGPTLQIVQGEKQLDIPLQ